MKSFSFRLRMFQWFAVCTVFFQIVAMMFFVEHWPFSSFQMFTQNIKQDAFEIYQLEFVKEGGESIRVEDFSRVSLAIYRSIGHEYLQSAMGFVKAQWDDIYSKDPENSDVAEVRLVRKRVSRDGLQAEELVLAEFPVGKGLK